MHSIFPNMHSFLFLFQMLIYPGKWHRIVADRGSSIGLHCRGSHQFKHIAVNSFFHNPVICSTANIIMETHNALSNNQVIPGEFITQYSRVVADLKRCSPDYEAYSAMWDERRKSNPNSLPYSFGDWYHDCRRLQRYPLTCLDEGKDYLSYRRVCQLQERLRALHVRLDFRVASPARSNPVRYNFLCRNFFRSPLCNLPCVRLMLKNRAAYGIPKSEQVPEILRMLRFHGLACNLHEEKHEDVKTNEEENEEETDEEETDEEETDEEETDGIGWSWLDGKDGRRMGRNNFPSFPKLSDF
jgi:hypothetical protein